MAHISSSFSDPDAGVLTVTLSGEYYFGSIGRDAGFPGGGSTAGYISITGYVGPSGSTTTMHPIDNFAPVSIKQFDYPGGDVEWVFGTVEVSHVNPSSGFWSYGMRNLSMHLVLAKKVA